MDYFFVLLTQTMSVVYFNSLNFFSIRRMCVCILFPSWMGIYLITCWCIAYTFSIVFFTKTFNSLFEWVIPFERNTKKKTKLWEQIMWSNDTNNVYWIVMHKKPIKNIERSSRFECFLNQCAHINRNSKFVKKCLNFEMI